MLRYKITTELEQEKLSQFLRIGLSCPAEGTLQIPEKTGMKTVSITSVIFFAKAPIGYSKRIPFHFKNAKRVETRSWFRFVICA
ncbi:hypothetical protein RCO48_32515 [Peribacillus frigoritolerans]|nr:hypothetical protein [Peribacillus frigoritolerans]